MGVQDFAALLFIFSIVWLFVRIEGRSIRRDQREYTNEARLRVTAAKSRDQERIDDLAEAVESLIAEIERLKGHS